MVKNIQLGFRLIVLHHINLVSCQWAVDKIKNFFSKILIPIFLLVGYSEFISQCTSNNFPANGTVNYNGITVTTTSTAFMAGQDNGTRYICGTSNAVVNGIAWGIAGTTEINFSKPVNNIIFQIANAGSASTYQITSNKGTSNIADLGSCNLLLLASTALQFNNNNVIGGGVFRLSSTESFTRITINFSSGRDAFGNNGNISYFGLCGSSVLPLTGLTKSVSPSVISEGGTATYTFTIDNNFGTSTAQTGLGFTDTLPSGLRVAPNPNIQVSPTLTGGTTTATPGGNSIAVAGYSIAANSTGTITVNITNAPGQVNNSCGANPAAFTNRNSNISNSSSNLGNEVGNVCLVVINDKDGDGIADSVDLDNDNDGIKDTEECGSTNRVTNGTFPTSGGNTDTVPGWTVGGTYSTVWPSNTGRVNLNANGLEFRRDENTVTTLQQSLTGVTAGATISLSQLYWFRTAGTETNNFFTLTISYGGVTYATINSTSGSTPTISSSNGARVNITTLPTVATQVSVSTKTNLNITLPFTGIASTGDLLLTFTAGPAATQVRDIGMQSITVMACKDTDNDGIPDYLDLDSDNDGCVDAIEGDENVTAAQLVTAASGLSAGSPTTAQNQNLCASGSCVDTQGVPTLVNSGGAADIGGDQGQGIGSSQNSSINGCLDSDGDGITDDIDLDDDNDGILDTDERGCANPLNALAPTTTGVVKTYYGSGATAFTATFKNATINGGMDAGQTVYGYKVDEIYNSTSSDTNVVTFNRPVYGLDVALDDVDNAETATLRFYDASGNLISANGYVVNVGSGIGSVTYPAGQSIYVTSPSGNQTGAPSWVRITFPKTMGISRIEQEQVRPGTAGYNDMAILGGCFDIDSDNDGIWNRLDLDSDNDGCVDAIEGDENVTTAQLITAASGLSVGTGSAASNQNLCATGSCIDTQGVPTVVNSGGAADIGGDQGQGAGFSQNATLNECDALASNCTKPGTIGTSLPSKVGILTKAKKDEAWPGNVPNGHIVLDGAEKGFVITQMTTAQRDLLTPVEGMMIYNTDASANCVQLYRGTAPASDPSRTGWNCITPSCGARQVKIGRWNSFSFDGNHAAYVSQLTNTANYGPSGIFKGVSGFSNLDATANINAAASTYSAAQLKANYDIIVTGYNNTMTAATATKLKDYTDLGGVVFVLMDGFQVGNAMNTAFGGSGPVSQNVDNQAGSNAQARTLNNQISNGIFNTATLTGGGITITGANGSSVPPVANIPAGSFITAYMNYATSTGTNNTSSTENIGVYITGTKGRAIFVYDEGIYRNASVSGTAIDTAQEVFLHNLMSYALQKAGFSSQ